MYNKLINNDALVFSSTSFFNGEKKTDWRVLQLWAIADEIEKRYLFKRRENVFLLLIYFVSYNRKWKHFL